MSLRCNICNTRAADQDLVSVANKYNFIFPSLGKDQFITCYAFKRQMEIQSKAFNSLSRNGTNWDFLSDPLKETEVDNHIRLGVPPEYRSKVWQHLARVIVTPEQIARYRELREIKHHQYATQIERDVERTFEITDPAFIAKLSNVLTAYVHYNPSVGYCQSMNILAATLLIFMEEEYAFKMLIYIIDIILPNFHSEGLTGYHEAVAMLKFLIASELPELNSHFQSIHFDISDKTSEWFLSLFMHTVPNVTGFVIWDNIMMKGTNAIFEVGLAILKMIQNDLLAFDDSEYVLVYLPRRMKQLHNPQYLFKHWLTIPEEKIQLAKEAVFLAKEEIVKAEQAIKDNFQGSPFEEGELANMWIQYAALSPILCCRNSGLGPLLFAQFMEGTFSEWYLDGELLENLFQIVDRNQDGIVDFSELVCFVYVICRGSFFQFAEFILKLYDSNGKGYLDKSDLTRLLRSSYGMFAHDPSFHEYTAHFTNDIFGFHAIAPKRQITKENLLEVALVQRDIQDRFLQRNPTIKIVAKKTLFFWLNLTLNPRRKLTETILISFKHKTTTNYHQASAELVFGTGGGGDAVSVSLSTPEFSRRL